MQIESSNLAERMRLLMAKNGESNRQLAAEVSTLLGFDVSYETIRRLAKGAIDEDHADLMIVSALAVHWNVSLSELSETVYARTASLAPLVRGWADDRALIARFTGDPLAA